MGHNPWEGWEVVREQGQNKGLALWLGGRETRERDSPIRLTHPRHTLPPTPFALPNPVTPRRALSPPAPPAELLYRHRQPPKPCFQPLHTPTPRYRLQDTAHARRPHHPRPLYPQDSILRIFLHSRFPSLGRILHAKRDEPVVADRLGTLLSRRAYPIGTCNRTRYRRFLAFAGEVW